MPKRLAPRGEAAPPVEPIVTGATLPPKTAPKKRPKPKVSESGVRYVRNLHHIKARVTLTTGREINLEPRGQREDLDIVNVAEQEDPRFLANMDLLFEVIPVELAKQIIAKQRTNINRQHPAWEHLRNENGKPYEKQQVNTATPESITVAEIRPTSDGRYTQHNTELKPPGTHSPLGPQYTTAPGSIGDPATQEMLTDVPTEISPEDYHEFLLWKRFKEAMAAQEADPEEYRESLNVTVEPTQTAPEEQE